MRTRTISRYALGVAAAAMLTVPTAGVAGAIPIIPSDGGNNASAEDTAGTEGDKDTDSKDTGADKSGAGSSDKGSSGSGTISGVGEDADSDNVKSESGSNITSTVTTTTTPAPGDDEDVTLDEPAAEETPAPAPAPNEEDLAVTGNSTQVFAGALAVLALLAAGGYVFAMRRTNSTSA